MLVEQVYALDAEALQRLLRNFPYMFRTAVQAVRLAVFDVETELGRDDYLVPQGGKGFPNKLLVGMGPIHLGRVEERGRIFKNVEEVRAAAIAFKDRYNRDWRLEKLGFMSPLEARQARLLKQAA